MGFTFTFYSVTVYRVIGDLVILDAECGTELDQEFNFGVICVYFSSVSKQVIYILPISQECC